MTTFSLSDPDEAGRAIVGLARELEGQRRRLDDLAGLADQLHDLAVVVASFAEREIAPEPRVPRPVSWLAYPDESDDPAASMAARSHLGVLIDWMEAIYLRYPDAGQSLPECWLWHPDVIEELTWLREAWTLAYRGSSASTRAVSDWHDRQRPGVTRRLKAVAGLCSLEKHEAEATRGRARAPLAGCAGRIADWWTRARHDLAPAPVGLGERSREW